MKERKKKKRNEKKMDGQLKSNISTITEVSSFSVRYPQSHIIARSQHSSREDKPLWVSKNSRFLPSFESGLRLLGSRYTGH